MEFKNLLEIKQKFQIKSNVLGEIRRELVEKIAKVHPDNFGISGDWPPDKIEEKELYYSLDSAIIFLDNLISGISDDSAIVMVNDQTNLTNRIDELSKNLVDFQQMYIVKADIVRNIDNNIKNNRHESFSIGITLTTITAVLSFIWAFPSLLSTHPILGGIFQSVQDSYILAFALTIIWLYALFFTIVFWWFAYRAENRQKKAFESLKRDSTQRALLDVFLKEIERMEFAKDELISFIQEKYAFFYKFSFFKFGGIDYETASSIAEAIILKSMRSGILVQNENGTFNDTFTVVAKITFGEVNIGEA